MKVLHVIPSISPARGGPSFAIESMTHALVEAHVEVEVATTEAKPLGAAVSPRLGVHHAVAPRGLASCSSKRCVRAFPRLEAMWTPRPKPLSMAKPAS